MTRLSRRALRQLVNDFMSTSSSPVLDINRPSIVGNAIFGATVERYSIQFNRCSWAFMCDSRCDWMACSSVYLALLLGFVYAIAV